VPDIDEPDVLIQIRDYAMHEIFANAGPFAISSTIDKSEIARLNVPALSKTVRFGRHADGSIELEIREYGHYAAKFFNTRGAVLAELHGNGPASRFIAPRFSTGTIIVQVKTGSGMYRRNILLP